MVDIRIKQMETLEDIRKVEPVQKIQDKEAKKPPYPKVKGKTIIDEYV